MNAVFKAIENLVDDVMQKPDFLHALFGDMLNDVRRGKPVVIFGCGSLGQEIGGTLKYQGIEPAAFCDNNKERIGTWAEGIPVVSVARLQTDYRDGVVIIAVLKHREAIHAQLVDAGFNENRIRCGDSSADFLYLYCMEGTQLLGVRSLIPLYEQESRPDTVLGYLRNRQDDIARAHDALSDEKSRNLLITKLALVAAGGCFELYRHFIENFSEPYLKAGIDGWNRDTEDYYYFHNDVIRLKNGEVYVDVGAYDGDTIITFAEACSEAGVSYKHLYALEPDSSCFEALRRNVAYLHDVTCFPLGAWSETGTLRFNSSGVSLHDQAGAISSSGDTSIEVTTLDTFMPECPTFIKMDPGGNVIPEAVRGAADTIRASRPTLALGAYHSIRSIYEIPLQVHALCPDYRLYLRHNSVHLCDTVLFASLS